MFFSVFRHPTPDWIHFGGRLSVVRYRHFVDFLFACNLLISQKINVSRRSCDFPEISPMMETGGSNGGEPHSELSSSHPDESLVQGNTRAEGSGLKETSTMIRSRDPGLTRLLNVPRGDRFEGILSAHCILLGPSERPSPAKRSG